MISIQQNQKNATQFEEMVASEGYSLLSPYINATTKVELMCPHGHSYLATPSKFRSGRRCPTCSGKPQEGRKESFVGELQKDGYKLSGVFKNMRTKVSITCPEGHTYTVRPNHFTSSGSRCPHCAGLTKEAGEKKLREEVENRGYSLSPTFVYINTDTKVDLTCPKGHLYSVLPYSFISGCDCPKCPKRRGYRYDIGGFFYVYRWSFEEKSFLKFGITNNERTLKRRLSNQVYQTEYTPTAIIKQYFEDGSIPVWIEDKAKSVFDTSFIDKKLFPDGYTETVEDTHDNISKLENIIAERLL